jgi:hypothetical protein
VSQLDSTNRHSRQSQEGSHHGEAQHRRAP